jgi:hypothetical protein
MVGLKLKGYYYSLVLLSEKHIVSLRKFLGIIGRSAESHEFMIGVYLL